MTREQFVDHIIEQHPGMVRSDAKKIIILMWNAIRGALEKGESIQITGVGVIAPRIVKRDFMWKHPSTGKMIRLRDRVRIEFRSSHPFKELLTQKFVTGLKRHTE